MPLWTVAIETVATAGSVALLQDDQLHAEQPLPAESRSARTLVPVIQTLWQQAGKPPISLVAVAHGPGSFTGLRVGVITAKTLAFAWNATLIGVPTLDAIAAQVPITDSQLPAKLQVVLDAQRQELFIATFERLPANHQPRSANLQPWQKFGTDSIVSIKTWLEPLSLHDPQTANVQVAGPALAKLRNRLPPTIQISADNTWHPRAAAVAHLARQAQQAGAPNELWTLTPQYLRVSYAEEGKRS